MMIDWKISLLVFLLGNTFFAEAADNSTEEEKALRYKRLYMIPGNDFVGFGYDAKFADPIQAVRLPLSDWSYDERKTYKYPVYRDFVYRVPDQLFVRTVARTDMNNFVFLSVDELSEKIAVGAGLNYSRSSEGTSTGEMSVGEKLALLEALSANSTNSSTGNNTSFQEAGYGDTPFLPGEQTTTGSSLFSIGAEINYIRNSVKTANKYIVQNEQINQFYQLFLDKRKLRQEFVDDALALAGRTWNSNDRKLFINFFEKYGTHVIVSAMMGGAISMTSVVQNTAEVTTDTVNVNIDILFNETQFTGSNITKEEAFIANSPNCTGAYSGYLFNTLSRQCVLPPSVTCFAPNTDFDEQFTSLTVPETANWEFASNIVGPNALPTRSETTYVSAYGFCKPSGVAEVVRTNISNPFTGTLQVNRDTTVNFELDTVNRADYQGWELKATQGDEVTNHRITMFGNEAACQSSCCPVVRNCWACYFQPCAQFNRKFRIFPCLYPKRTAKTNPVFYKGPSVNITTFGWSDDTTSTSSLIINSRTQEFDRNFNAFRRLGRVFDLKNPSRPGYFRFSTRLNAPNLVRPWSDIYERNVLEILDAGDKSTQADDQYILKFKIKTTQMFIDRGGIEILIPEPVANDKWYNFIINFNWTAATFDLWIDYNNSNTNPTKVPKQQRMLANIPFIVPTASRITRVQIYNYDTITSYWDDFKFCNAYDTAKYEPVSKTAAVQSTTSKFRQTVNGAVDFGFEQEFGKYTFSQSSNYRLKGGDSSKVDLLDLRKAYNTFEVWKGTIMGNPAPVSFVLKKLSHLLPDEEVNGVNRRDEMAFAIEKFFEIDKSTSLVVLGNPDVANNTVIRSP